MSPRLSPFYRWVNATGSRRGRLSWSPEQHSDGQAMTHRPGAALVVRKGVEDGGYFDDAATGVIVEGERLGPAGKDRAGRRAAPPAAFHRGVSDHIEELLGAPNHGAGVPSKGYSTSLSSRSASSSASISAGGAAANAARNFTRSSGLGGRSTSTSSKSNAKGSTWDWFESEVTGKPCQKKDHLATRSVCRLTRLEDVESRWPRAKP